MLNKHNLFIEFIWFVVFIELFVAIYLPTPESLFLILIFSPFFRFIQSPAQLLIFSASFFSL